jgi:hypothetical protein
VKPSDSWTEVLKKVIFFYLYFINSTQCSTWISKSKFSYLSSISVREPRSNKDMSFQQIYLRNLNKVTKSV